jgi:hypothetical protein
MNHLVRIIMHVCNRYTQFAWIVLASLTFVLEVIPIPRLPMFVHYGVYNPLKMVLFIVVGYCAPLAFASFNAMRRGLVFAFISAASLEAIQGIVGGGHRFHVYEALLKCLLIAAGFMFGLGARMGGTENFGFLRITFIDDGRSKRMSFPLS